MKYFKLLVTVLITALMFTAFAVAAEETDIIVTVTISDASGTLPLVLAEVTVSDLDDDGALTICDALIAAHDAHYDGGSSAGFGYASTDYGLSLTKLWGVDNGGAYGYYVNNSSALSLADAVKDGDYIYAYVYSDTQNWSDRYLFFTENEISTTNGNSFELTLCEATFDADWAPVVLPVSGAKITIDGKDIGVTTNDEGKATVTVSENGSFILSATLDGSVIVPPVCKVNTASETPATGDSVFIYIAMLVTAVLSASLVLCMTKKHAA